MCIRTLPNAASMVPAASLTPTARPMRTLFAAFVALVFAVPSLAQVPTDMPQDPGAEDEETPYEAFTSRFQRDEFRITSLIQVVPRIAFEDTEGNQPRFDIPRARLGIRGNLDNGIGYGLQAEFSNRVSLLDAIVTYGTSDVKASLGRQQTPYSAENLASDAALDFVDRARVVSAVAPGRSIGAQLLATPGGGPVGIRAGLYNPTQTLAVDGTDLDVRDRGGVLLVGRVQSVLDVDGGSVTLAANAAYTTDDTSTELESPGELDLGVDARARLGRLLVAGEFLRGRIEEPFAASAPTGLDGGYVTLGYDVTPADRVLTRLDVIAVEDRDASTLVLLGYERTLTRSAMIQANLIIPVADANDGFDQPLQLTGKFQFAF